MHYLFILCIEKINNAQDVEEESVAAKKTTPSRGGGGSKRSRAAEVHNLSERVIKSFHFQYCSEHNEFAYFWCCIQQFVSTIY